MKFVVFEKITGEWRKIANKIAKILETKGIIFTDKFDPNIPNVAEIYLVKHRLGEELNVKLSLPELVVSYTIENGKVTAGSWFPYGNTYGLKPKYSNIQEFLKALEQLPNFSGQNYIVYDTLKCQKCGKFIEADADEYPEKCPYCGSDELRFVTVKKYCQKTEKEEKYEWYPDAPYWQPDF